MCYNKQSPSLYDQSFSAVVKAKQTSKRSPQKDTQNGMFILKRKTERERQTDGKHRRTVESLEITFDH